MGHLRLAREADLVVVAPASADILAKMAPGIADDLATTALLATDKPVLVAPAMNVRMWEHPATQENMSRLEARGVLRVGPGAGPLAEDESGVGRMAEVGEIVAAIEQALGGDALLAGRRALVTSGPTHEAIDPARYLTNRSSGKQGHAIARAPVTARTRRSSPVRRTRPIRPASPSSASNRRKRCWRPAARRCPWTSPSAPPPSPTGASPKPPRRS